MKKKDALEVVNYKSIAKVSSVDQNYESVIPVTCGDSWFAFLRYLPLATIHLSWLIVLLLVSVSPLRAQSTQPTQTALTLSSASAGYGTPITITASVGTTPVGQVNITDNGFTICSGQLDSSRAPITCTISTFSIGNHPLQAEYLGGTSQSTTYSASTSSIVSLIISEPTPALTVSTSGTPSTYGGSVTFTATISSGPTGIITFYDGGTSIGTGSISGTTATFSTSTLAAGAHSITAGWAGNTNYSAVTSSAVTQLVNKATPTLAVVTSGTPSTYGGSVTFTATISSGPTGPITFYDGGTSIGTGSISGTTATFTTSTLAAGTHSITAGWAGNTNYSAVTSGAVTQSVNEATPTLAVATSGTPSNYGGSVTFTATISSGPTGVITFYDGGTSIGTGSISGTTATFSTSTLAAGAHSITAGWAGNTNYSAVTSGAVTQSVNEATPTLAVATSGTPSNYGGSVTFTATISSGPTGIITFYDGTTSIGTGSISGTTATFTATTLAGGFHSITAGWAGNANYSAVTSGAVTQSVNEATPTLAVATSGTPSTYGGSVTFTATISSGPIGTITFYDGTTSIGTGPISGTTATFSTSTLAPGAHSITAGWNGNTNYSAVTSSSVTQTVNASTEAISLSVSSSGVSQGTAVTFTATVRNGTTPVFPGLVRFCDASAGECEDMA
ncbi:beta strand repeat-containing protein, partial [Acidicapsa ligni]|uniref:beta strand repeat-containing protein n=1 Tax=Acidicapsa ligni TaxID=542300 RepID=UPI0021DF7F23